MLAEIGGNPLDAEDLAAVVVVDDFDAAIGNPHVPYLWITERVGIDIGPIIAGDSLTQVMNADCWHQFDGWPWLGMPRVAAVCPSQLPRHSHQFNSPSVTAARRVLSRMLSN